MAAPNLIGASLINGKVTGANLSSTSMTSVVSNASGSGKCFKINTLNACNFSNSSAQITIAHYTAAALGGTATFIAGNITIPAYSTLNIIDRSSQYYLEEDNSVGAQASVSNALAITVSYEDIS